MSESAAQPPASRRIVPDRHQIERLNRLWEIIEPPRKGGGPRTRAITLVRRFLSRLLSRQQEFNASLVDHLNRNQPVLEQIGAAAEHMDDIVHEMRLYREALLARERRSEAAVSALTASHEELRATVSVLQQAAQNIKREVQRGQTGVRSGSDSSGTVPNASAPSSQMDALDSHKYVGFEDAFRGSSEDIRRRVTEYMPLFAGASDVLDIGCGRGEFLALLREQGVTGRGVDLNAAMVEVCREQGLDATEVDGLTYLRSLPDGSLGGLFAAQVVEHLEPRYLTQLLDAAYDKLRPGSPIVLETINPACWFAFFESYIRDITHVRPLHPDTLKYLLIASGFTGVDIRYRAPYPEPEKLQPVTGAAASPDGSLADWAETINGNVEKLNRLLFTYLDYAAVGRRS